jgi:hypothetical protein
VYPVNEVDVRAGATLTRTRVLSPWVRPNIEHLVGSGCSGFLVVVELSVAESLLPELMKTDSQDAVVEWAAAEDDTMVGDGARRGSPKLKHTETSSPQTSRTRRTQ